MAFIIHQNFIFSTSSKLQRPNNANKTEQGLEKVLRHKLGDLYGEVRNRNMWDAYDP